VPTPSGEVPPLPRPLAQLVLRRLRDERGIALIAAIGILGVLSLTGTSVVFYSSANARSSAHSGDVRVAAHVAEGGFNYAVAILGGAANAQSPSALPPGTTTIDGETVSYSGVLNGDTWTIKAISSVKNPTGAAPIQRTVSGKVRVFLDAGASENAAYHYVYADDTTTCTTFPNSVVISAPLFIKGNLCMQNSAQVVNGPLKVGGTVSFSNTATIGTSTARLTSAEIGGGCRVNNGAFTSPCGDAQRVFVDGGQAGTNPGILTKPPIDLNKWYGESRPGPLHPCTVGFFPGGFDTNASPVVDAYGNYVTRDRSLPAVTLTPAAPYDCIYKEGDHTLGRIAWTGGTNGTLTIMGTIYFDGDIILTSNTIANYRGRGTIYASGRIELGNSFNLCAAPNCDRDAWDPNENLLLFVAGTSTDATGFYIHNNARFQGAAYVVNDYREENFVDMQGPVIARQLYYQNNTEAVKWVPIWSLLTGAPSSSTSTRVTSIEGSWIG
jgi:hypothetical protein